MLPYSSFEVAFLQNILAAVDFFICSMIHLNVQQAG
jgi:hypothetical protein